MEFRRGDIRSECGCYMRDGKEQVSVWVELFWLSIDAQLDESEIDLIVRRLREDGAAVDIHRDAR